MNRSQTALLGALACLLGLAALTLLVALRAYRSEMISLRPERRTVPRPGVPELAHLETVELSGDEGAVRGWYQASRNGALVLLVHGLGGDRS